MRLSFFSIRAAHEAQVMPPMASSTREGSPVCWVVVIVRSSCARLLGKAWPGQIRDV
jgi:hypothetical protein